MVGVGKEVGGELVVVPHEGVAPVAGNILEIHLREVLVHHEAVEAVYQHVDARGLGRSQPIVFPSIIPLGQKAVGHRGGAGLRPGNVERGGAAMGPEDRQPRLGYQFILVMAVVPVIVGVAIAHRGKGTERLVDAVVHVGVQL